MKTERQIAELIFDLFRASNCKTNEIVMMRSINFELVPKLNPKEKELFYTVFNGLIFTGYFTYEKDPIECIRLTEKGYDYIYDDEQVASMLKLPWVFPDITKPEWDKAFNRLWRVIGPKDSAPHYIGGGDFYKIIMELADDIPPSYGKYIEERRKKDLSTSRVDYYSDLFNDLDEDNRKLFFAKIQIFIEVSILQQEGENAGESSDIDVFFGSENSETDTTIETTVKEDESGSENPIVFISYSWDTPAHEAWVLGLATKLRKNGVDVILDKWDLGPLGKPLPHFMENAVRKAKRVICVLTPNYKLKTDDLKGGVGYEYSIISSEIFADVTTSKFIPLFRTGPKNQATPTALNGRKYIDITDGVLSDEKMEELLRDIYEEPKYKKPPIGEKPTFD